LLITSVPELGTAMKLAGSAYLLYLAYQIAGARALKQGIVARPIGLIQAAAFQAINPKAWIFALGAITTFRPTGMSTMIGGALVALTMMVVVMPTASLWAAGGRLLGPLLVRERAQRIISVILAIVLAATVAYVWT
jgi:threonine/homoserine/homoserine lactone efflux protein